MVPPKYYTTFQAAKLLGVSLATVVNWTRDGLLAAHRTPGGHRRIAEQDLVAFARAYSLPMPEELADAGSSRRRVLIVDDDPDYLETVSKLLTLKGGYDVEVARSGFGMGVAVQRFRPDAILMDIRMPGLDGFEVTENLKNDRGGRPVPVIACSAFGNEDTQARIESVFDGFIAKPLDYDALLARLEQLLP